LPLVTYFPMIQRYEASIYMLGWGVPTFDALYSLQSLTRSVGTGGDGNYNVGRYSNPRMDAMWWSASRSRNRPEVRTELLTEALQLSNDTVSHLPLHNQISLYPAPPVSGRDRHGHGGLHRLPAVPVRG
jgi:peptide/nickel transport system substrate-binding protein